MIRSDSNMAWHGLNEALAHCYLFNSGKDNHALIDIDMGRSTIAFCFILRAE